MCAAWTGRWRTKGRRIDLLCAHLISAFLPAFALQTREVLRALSWICETQTHGGRRGGATQTPRSGNQTRHSGGRVIGERLQRLKYGAGCGQMRVMVPLVICDFVHLHVSTNVLQHPFIWMLPYEEMNLTHMYLPTLPSSSIDSRGI